MAKVKGQPETVNERLLDREVRHLLYLTRVSNGEERQLIADLEKMLPVLLDRIQRSGRSIEGGVVLSSRAHQRLQTLARNVHTIVRASTKAAETNMTGRLTDIAEYEADFQKRLLESAVPVEFIASVPPLSRVSRAVFARPMSGVLFDEWFTRLSDSTASRVMQAVREGILAGESMRDITRRIEGTRALNYQDGTFQQVRNAAERLARTAVIHTSSLAKEMVYSENADMIKAVQWVATLDTRTCLICGDRDTEEYPVNEGHRPPAHPNCRCTTVPVLYHWRHMPLDIPGGSRASMDGQVPEALTYNQWLKQQPAAIQDEALGRQRGLAFRKGDLQVSDFVNRRDRVFTLDELRQREADAFS